MAEARYKRQFRNTTRARRAYLRALHLYLGKTTIVFDAEMGRRLAEVRMRMGESQKKFAERFGVSQSHICRVEIGKSDRLPISTSQFTAALSEYFHYVLFGGVLLQRKKEEPIENVWLARKRRDEAKN